jgi:hypothetical protein
MRLDWIAPSLSALMSRPATVIRASGLRHWRTRVSVMLWLASRISDLVDLIEDINGGRRFAETACDRSMLEE